MNLKKTLLTTVTAGAIIGSVVGLAGAATDTPSASKATAKVADFSVLEANAQSNGEWVDILSTNIMTANQKDLFVDVSLQSGLYTKTVARSKDMVKDTSTASAGVEVRVLVDGKEAAPGDVIFNQREQELSATLQGQVDLVDKDQDGVIEEGELAVVAPEEISLLLNTVSANSFDFVLPDVQSGNHTVTVQAKITDSASFENGSAEASAVIGKGAVTVEEVRMVKDNNIQLQ